MGFATLDESIALATRFPIGHFPDALSIKFRTYSRSLLTTMLQTTRSRSTWVLLTGVSLFAILAWQVQVHGKLFVIDQSVVSWMHAHMTGTVTALMLIVTHWHNTLGIVAMGLIAAVVLVRQKNWPGLRFLLLSLGGGMLLNVLLKLAFARSRPAFDDPVVSLASFSFPSGHAAGSTLLYGTLTVLLARQGRWQGRALWAGMVMVVLVGLSRIYLGAHYPSDVLAGVSVGLVWISACRLVTDRQLSCESE